MIDIQDRNEIFLFLRQLPPDRKPLFGAMTPQHMVEHLAHSVRFSNGREPQPHYYTPEKEQRFKAYMMDAHTSLVPGFRSPVMPAEGLPDLLHTSLAEALTQLEDELQAFDRFFQENPEATPVNPAVGELGYKEWVVFHNKHFRHHLGQFGFTR
ncbi:MAG: DUF1569 domain-containing protein [Siphonobacter aquaeclarae]|nr:DUF1569 domain-containing protein [Siphonobacter aquaeclarae]